jgi:hypothetical protein
LDLWNQWFAYAAWLQNIDSRDFGRKIFEMRILQGRKTKADPLFTPAGELAGDPGSGTTERKQLQKRQAAAKTKSCAERSFDRQTF